MFGWFSVLKSKWTWIAIALTGAVFFVLNYGSLKEDLGKAYSNISRLGDALETTNDSINKLEKEMKKWDNILIKREKERKRISEEVRDLKKELLKERSRNEKLDACWDVEFSSDYLDRLRNKNYSSGNEGKENRNP